MSDPRTFWLVVTNIVLGLAVLMLVAGLAAGTICDLLARRRRGRAAMRDLDRDTKDLFQHH